jgi:hypothetical protein
MWTYYNHLFDIFRIDFERTFYDTAHVEFHKLNLLQSDRCYVI